MVQDFKLKGLNRRTNLGCYATVEYGKEDWFHADFDESKVSIDRQYALFDYFKNGDDNVWKDNNDAKVVVKFDGYGIGNIPVNPIIIAVKNIQ